MFYDKKCNRRQRHKMRQFTTLLYVGGALHNMHLVGRVPEGAIEAQKHFVEHA